MLRATAALLSGRAGDGERCRVQKQQRPQHVCISKGVEAGHFISRPLVHSCKHWLIPESVPPLMVLCSTFNLISSALSFRWGWKSNTRKRTGPPLVPFPILVLSGVGFFSFFFSFFTFCLFFVFFCLDTTRKRVNSWSHDRGYGRSPIRLCPFHWSRTGTGQRSARGWVGGNSNILHRQSIWKVFLM